MSAVGACRIRVDGNKDWQGYSAGSSFRVPGKAGFDILVEQGLVEYVCTFE